MAPTPYVPWSEQQTYIFSGTLVGGKPPAKSFQVLAGEKEPIITAGWPKVNTIDRSRRLGFTQPVGNDPLGMEVPIQFEAFVKQPGGTYAISPNIEIDISSLEWMAGRGPEYGAMLCVDGDPPLVTLGSYDKYGTESDLIPRLAQGVQWLVADIKYGVASRNRAGHRNRQTATVSLSQYVSVPNADTADSAASRQAARQTNKYVTFKATQKDNTVAKITRRVTNKHTVAAYKAVLAFSRKHGFKYKSYLVVLPVGTVVYIPASVLY